MQGLPNVLKTRADFENCHDLALQEPPLRKEMVQNWQGLIDGQHQWMPSTTKPDTAEGKPDYKVMPGQEGEEPSVFKKTKISNSELEMLGYTEADALAKINELEA